MLLVDIGNSRVKAAWAHPDATLQRVTLRRPADLRHWAGKPIVYVDVRRAEPWRRVLRELQATELTPNLGLPFPSAYSQTLGPDRAAQILAAWQAGKYPAVILSLGTACVLDYLDEAGRHQGGIITAGAHLRLRALGTSTGLLPILAPCEAPLAFPGRTTEEALQIGVVQGLAFELQGWLRYLASEQTSPTLWVTGGEAPLLLPLLPTDAIFVPDLTLRGMWLWWHALQKGSSA
ncbi:MAG: type III pantothenate kinase [Bacteroidia bacterium]